LVVESRLVSQSLTFDKTTGETIVAARQPCAFDSGTRISISFGLGVPADPNSAMWARLAIELAGDACHPMLTHPTWYSEAAFQELVQAAPDATAQELAALFGIEFGNATDREVEQGQFDVSPRYSIDPLSPASAISLDLLKSLSPKPPRLIPIAQDIFGGAYKIERTDISVGGATVPALIQVSASQLSTRATRCSPTLIVNRTVAVAEISVVCGGEAYVKGCGIGPTSIGTVPKGDYDLTIAITTPAIALISDGKTPDLSPFQEFLPGIIGSVLRRAHRPKSRGRTIKDAAYDVMEEAYLRASASGTLPANARQVMYAARPYILEHTGQSKLNDSYFTQTLLPTFMEERPELTANWDVVYDARGHLVEPHTGYSLPLGTLHVREYLRRQSRHDEAALISTATGLHSTTGPNDRYGAVLFIEKEGFEPLLRAARIAERFDIAVMSTKGMSRDSGACAG
jgi:hypothetical protein